MKGVRDFRVELNGIKMTGLIGHPRNRTRWRGSHDLEASGQLSHFVAVTHPDLEHPMTFWCGKVFNAIEQCCVTMRAHFGITKLARLAGFDFAAQLFGHGLHAIANAQNRDA